MDWAWILSSAETLIMVVISTLGIYGVLVLFTRLYGVRTFSKASSFDFAVTIAIGSLLTTTVVSKDPALLQGIVALATFFIIQMTVARMRIKSTSVHKLVDNKPILLMVGTQILEDNMKKARVNYSDLLSKLRQSNVTQLRQVKAVVMETTGDISVLHHSDENHEIDDALLEDLREEEALKGNNSETAGI